MVKNKTNFSSSIALIGIKLPHYPIGQELSNKIRACVVGVRLLM